MRTPLRRSRWQYVIQQILIKNGAWLWDISTFALGWPNGDSCRCRRLQAVGGELDENDFGLKCFLLAATRGHNSTTEDPPAPRERERKKKRTWSGRGKNKRDILGPHPLGPHASGPPPFGHRSGPPPSRPPTLRPPPPSPSLFFFSSVFGLPAFWLPPCGAPTLSGRSSGPAFVGMA